MSFSFSFYGTRSLKVALSHHLCARIQSCRGDFRSALSSEREAYQIYRLQVKLISPSIEESSDSLSLSLQLGDEHERTRESAQVLKHLTEQAVVLQKRMNDVVKGQLLVIPSITVRIEQCSRSVITMLDLL